jgi:hypothetical protein
MTSPWGAPLICQRIAACGCLERQRSGVGCAFEQDCSYLFLSAFAAT